MTIQNIKRLIVLIEFTNIFIIIINFIKKLKLLLRKNYEASSRLFEKIFRKFVKFERKL